MLNKLINRDVENLGWLALGDGEKVVHWCHPSWIKYFIDILFSLTVMCIAVAMYYTQIYTSTGLSDSAASVVYYLSISLFLLGAGVIIAEIIHRYSTVYVITNKNIIKRTRVFLRDPQTTGIDNIQTHNIDQSIYGFVSTYVAKFLVWGDTRNNTSKETERDEERSDEERSKYRKLEFGTIEYSTAGMSGNDMRLPYVPDVYEFHRKVASQNRYDEDGNV